MTQAEINCYRAAASLGIIEDEMNPIFIFNGLRPELLIDIISGKIDAQEMARMEMRARGLDEKTGRWIGWRAQETRTEPA